jgi:hypothetical protein
MLNIKNISLLAALVCVLSIALPSTANQPVSTNVVANAAPTPPAKKTASANKIAASEAQPRKIDDHTAESPVYGINSKNCQNKDDEGSEGDDFVRKCKGFGGYSLWASGFGALINYRIESDNPKTEFVTYFFPLEGKDADKYIRADLFVQKLGDKVFWILDEKGKPYAAFVHAVFYKNTGSVKNSVTPKNKAAEFVLLRGLNGWKEIDTDIDAVNTAYNPDEWAKKTAYEIYEKKQK